ncbi:MAG: 2-iminoacetate synthase ThiH [Clostridia bacterium]|nr:2-iminoacetate synthase ThiH [Clostridia bacterium]
MFLDELFEKESISTDDFKWLLTDEAVFHLEAIAQRVHEKHTRFFGRTIGIYTPIYLANYCVNQCAYCSYNHSNAITRHQLTEEEIEMEAKVIYQMGIRHVLLLTGESKVHTPVAYIEKAVRIMKKYFDSVTIEIYPLDEEDYRLLIKAGVEGLTIYQETYNVEKYKKVHLKGPKSNYDYRYHAPERGAKAGMYAISLGVLLGLSDWRKDVYELGIHVLELTKKYPEVSFSISVPRIRPFKGQQFESQEISDQNLVQIILAVKMLLPQVGINLSTRESSDLREHLLPLGISKMSAGVSTGVGGHSSQKGDHQFEISDKRSVEDIKKMLINKGYQPAMKDWVTL